MKFEINEKVMKNILGKAVAAIDKRSGIDTLKRLYFEVKENTLEIMVQNHSTETIQLVLHTDIFNIDRENRKFAIHVDDVFVITKMKNTITMYIEEDKLYIESGKKKVNIPCFEYTEEIIEKISVNVSTRIMNIPGNEFLETCLNLSVFAEKEAANKLLNIIFLDIRKNRMISLDGNRMVIKHLKEDYVVKNTIEKDIMLHVYTIPILNKIIDKKDNSNLSISFNGKYIVIRNGELRLIVKNVEGQYFKVDQMLIGNGDGQSFVCDRTELLGIMKYDFDITKKEIKTPVIFYQFSGEMHIYCRTPRYECIDKLETKNSFVKNEFMIGFDPKFYIDVLEIIKEDKVNIEFMNPKAPAFINTEEYTFLILPVNINCAKDGQLMERIKKLVA